jgi:hypothetical protein
MDRVVRDTTYIRNDLAQLSCFSSSFLVLGTGTQLPCLHNMQMHGSVSTTTFIIRNPHYGTPITPPTTYCSTCLHLTNHLQTIQTTLSILRSRFDTISTIANTLADSKVLDDLENVDQSLHTATIQLVDIACSFAGVEQISQDPGMVVVQCSLEGNEGLSLRDAIADIERTLVWVARRLGIYEGRNDWKTNP